VKSVAADFTKDLLRTFGPAAPNTLAPIERRTASSALADQQTAPRTHPPRTIRRRFECTRQCLSLKSPLGRTDSTCRWHRSDQGCLSGVGRTSALGRKLRLLHGAEPRPRHSSSHHGLLQIIPAMPAYPPPTSQLGLELATKVLVFVRRCRDALDDAQPSQGAFSNETAGCRPHLGGFHRLIWLRLRCTNQAYSARSDRSAR
jgi:hypothetical protein